MNRAIAWLAATVAGSAAGVFAGIALAESML